MIFDHFLECDTNGRFLVDEYNEMVLEGYAHNVIEVAEALQERKIAKIADQIAEREDVRVVLIAGPSSSGKTTTSKRLSIQLYCNDRYPIPVSLDDYFLPREKTPLDANGEKDYECLQALDLDLLTEHITKFIAGEEVELPRYDFKTGESHLSGEKIKLRPQDVLILEGIHALNPELTKDLPQEKLFRIYASALTTMVLPNQLSVDAVCSPSPESESITPTDNRLLRRMTRDYKYRRTNAEETLHRWASVRAGEEKWILPFQHLADARLNTALCFEIGAIKMQVEPLLKEVPTTSPEYPEAQRLLGLLQHFAPLPDKDIPPTSLLREFLGGSSFKY